MLEEQKVDPSVPIPDTDLVFLLQAMQQQLLQLEKKVDLLISRPQEKFRERPPHVRSFERRSYSKPFRSHDYSHYHDKKERENSPGDRDSVPGHFYERRPQEKGRRSNPGRKPFAFKRKDREQED
jgi:hypothetical protein